MFIKVLKLIGWFCGGVIFVITATLLSAYVDYKFYSLPQFCGELLINNEN
jgi:hypothetical protein